jgi:hypothetical protein
MHAQQYQNEAEEEQKSKVPELSSIGYADETGWSFLQDLLAAGRKSAQRSSRTG